MDKPLLVTNLIDDTVSEALGAAVIEYDGGEADHLLVSFNSNQTETYKDVKINPDLSPENRREFENLIKEFKDVFSDVPRVTDLGEHCIQLTSVIPVRSKAYPVPYAMKEALDKEIDLMLSLGVIEHSTAAYASPLVIVKKSDGSNRVCVDFRQLNKLTVFDTEPLPRMDEIFAELSGSKVFSKFDLSEGYWQVAMR